MQMIDNFLADPGSPNTRVATSLGEKIQGLFKDIQVRFQDLFQRRFTAMRALLHGIVNSI